MHSQTAAYSFKELTATESNSMKSTISRTDSYQSIPPSKADKKSFKSLLLPPKQSTTNPREFMDLYKITRL